MAQPLGKMIVMAAFDEDDEGAYSCKHTTLEAPHFIQFDDW